MTREIALYTLEGVPDARITTHPFNTDDGLGLSMLRFVRDPAGDVVLIIHGLTTSSDMFIMPEHRNLVRFLLDNGFTDVWTLDFRMSNRFPYNRARHRFTMDDIALFDFPAALRTLRAVVGERRVHVIAHCLGSVSFMMSLFGGAVGGIASVIANSVALTPRVPPWSQVKLAVAPDLAEYVLGLPYLDPNWHQEPRFTPGWLLSRLVDLVHPECDVPACHMLSLMWGTGWPALYSHDKLHPVTHARGGDLYGATGVHYYRHVRTMVRAGRAVKFDRRDARYDALPDDYLAGAAEVGTPVLFVTGEKNRVFTDSNIVCYERLEAVAPGRHELEVIPGYGHQDVFMGKDVHQDVFPRLLEFLQRQGA
ncbi:alpha/beta fold hydrolase [Pseudonocardia hispaniensis]|uniref:Alpha/beta fold hydrolase n=1 Tax=Pseudonocardia hispaniensis TaxID=904933 RepID=A0ABW1J5C1_9PSEU